MSTRFGIYPAYLFEDHDPVIDRVDTIIDDSGLTRGEVAARSRVSATTLYNWRRRKTKRPQFATVVAVIRTLGGDVAIDYEWKQGND